MWVGEGHVDSARSVGYRKREQSINARVVKGLKPKSEAQSKYGAYSFSSLEGRTLKGSVAVL